MKFISIIANFLLLGYFLFRMIGRGIPDLWEDRLLLALLIIAPACSLPVIVANRSGTPKPLPAPPKTIEKKPEMKTVPLPEVGLDVFDLSDEEEKIKKLIGGG